MYEGRGNKKMLNMLILKILEKYTDEDHRLTQQEILKLLKDNYGIECDRRSVRNNAEYLIDLGYDISIDDGYCLLSREFDDAELQLLINSVIFSKGVTRAQSVALIEKLKSKGNKYFSPHLSYIENYTDLQHTENKQVMINLDIIDDAMTQKRKISFIYNVYGTDFKMHPTRQEPFVFNPYQVVMSNGHYYLVGNYDKYDTISHFRIDRMTEMKLLEEPIKDTRLIKGMENGLNLPKHMAEHVYMFSGNSVSVLLKTDAKFMNDLVDWFGKDFQIMKKYTEDGVDMMEIHVYCNEQAMEYWALQYGKRVTVLEPESLREKIREDIEGMAERYR